MISGIYKFTFSNGSFYIGKSNDIAKRWDQHQKEMAKGTHTKKVQLAYNAYGEPEYEVIYECHQDHIDIMEGYFINAKWSDKILNTTRPPILSLEEIDILQDIDESLLDLSTIEHLLNIKELRKEKRGLQNLVREIEQEHENTIKNLKNGTLLIKLQKENAELNTHNQRLIELNTNITNELVRLKNRGLFSRIFNSGV